MKLSTKLTRHHTRYQRVEIRVLRILKLHGPLANVVQSFVVDTESLLGILNELMQREDGVVGFSNGVRNLDVRLIYSLTHLSRREYRISTHHSIRILFVDFSQQEGSEARTSTTTEGVGDLKTLEAIGLFGIASDSLQNSVDDFRSLSIVAFGKVVSFETFRIRKKKFEGGNQAKSV